ncbi:hypothetical protein C8D87_11649 [Lentzea atacamensis]|uniref:Secreted protein n=1 Tax=Lentzea atacamensis TaxID=531938 RepID=A0ABX9DV87_9PSEU|nr:DUF6355 family natural product biosynthesis protein [Lentzea atacamensis]RAS58996.1 hypothetical protein C8D87_11649 [Lentzea atacamensis]
MNRRLASAATALGVLLVSSAVGMIDRAAGSTAKAMPAYCGFLELAEPQGELTARYYHCGKHFILIRFHWSQGSTGTRCIEPWGTDNFYKDGPHKVVNAYYIKTPPNLVGPVDDLRCALSQPRA